ncbi:MAG: T9SS type A sorting domain-containing protein [candidate division WOR-3 bacterium]|nr:MAG: T9SS type A sorting domain-containing protein [candidate division WOR-3 bacterium]
MRSAVLALLVAATVSALGQGEFGIICSTDVRYATGPNNSHKLVYKGVSDSLTLFFQSRQSIRSCDGVRRSDRCEWNEPVLLYPGQNPGACSDGSDRHLVWQFPDTTSPGWEVYYRNMEYRMLPVNVSQTWGSSEHPDVWAEEPESVHVVWEDYCRGRPAIFHRTCNYSGTTSDTFRVSLDTAACCFFPSIEKYGDSLCVVWMEVDSGAESPYAIMLRLKVGAVWQEPEELSRSRLPLRSPSQDCALDGDAFTAAWEESIPGNLEARFEGGNPGGGYYTPDLSSVPVVSTMGAVYSYCYWEEEEPYVESDICIHLYYFMGGWLRYRLKDWTQMDEDMYCPTCLDGLMAWTQCYSGQEHSIWWYFPGYPIGVEEQEGRLRAGADRAVMNVARGVLTLRGLTPAKLLDITGRKAMDLTPGTNDVSGLAAGVYVLRSADGGKRSAVRKVVVQR